MTFKGGSTFQCNGSWGRTAGSTATTVGLATGITMVSDTTIPGCGKASRVTKTGAMGINWNRLSAIDSAGIANNLDISGTAYIESIIKFNTLPALYSEEFSSVADVSGGTIKYTLRITPDGRIAVHDSTAIASNTPTAISEFTLTTGTVYLIQRTSIVSTSGVITVTVWDWTNERLIGSFNCKGNFLSSNTMRIWDTAFTDRNGQNLVFDLLMHWVTDDAFVGTNMCIRKLMGNAVSATDAATTWDSFQSLSDANRYQEVNEQFSDFETTYVFSNGFSNGDAFGVVLQKANAANVQSDDILAVTCGAVMHDSGLPGAASGTSAVFRSGMRLGGTLYASDNTTPGNSLTQNSNFRGVLKTVNPTSLAAWTRSDFDSIEANVQAMTGGANEHRVPWLNGLVWFKRPTSSSVYTSKPDSVTGIDGLIDKLAQDTNGTSGQLVGVGHSNTGPALRRAFYIFDLTTIGKGRVITNATLGLVCTTGATTAVPGQCFMISGDAYDITLSQITWNTRSTTPGAWVTPGGDAAPITPVSFNLPTSTGAFNLDVTNMVQYAISKGYKSIGFILQRMDETTSDNNRAQFGLSRNTTEGNRATLTFTNNVSTASPTRVFRTRAGRYRI